MHKHGLHRRKKKVDIVISHSMERHREGESEQLQTAGSGASTVSNGRADGLVASVEDSGMASAAGSAEGEGDGASLRKTCPVALPSATFGGGGEGAGRDNVHNAVTELHSRELPVHEAPGSTAALPELGGDAAASTVSWCDRPRLPSVVTWFARAPGRAVPAASSASSPGVTSSERNAAPRPRLKTWTDTESLDGAPCSRKPATWTDVESLDGGVSSSGACGAGPNDGVSSSSACGGTGKRKRKGVRLEPGERVEALYSDGRWYTAVIVTVERGVDGQSSAGGAAEEEGKAGEAGVRVVLAWDDGDVLDTTKTISEVRALGTPEILTH